MRRSWAIWLSQDGARGWSLHTRAFSAPAAAVERDKYRTRGFHVRVAQEFGGHSVMTYAPINPPEREAPSRADGGPQTPASEAAAPKDQQERLADEANDDDRD